MINPSPAFTDVALSIYTVSFTGRRVGALGSHRDCFVRIAAPSAAEAARRFKANAASEYGYEFGPGYFLVSKYPFKTLTLGAFIVRALRNHNFNSERMAHLDPLMQAHAKRRPNSLVGLIYRDAYPFHVA